MNTSTTVTTSQTARIYGQLPRYFRWFTEHCVLRQLDGADVQRIWRAVVRPEFMECWSGNAPVSERDVKELVRRAAPEWLKGTDYAMAVVRRQSHDFAGFIAMHAVGPTRSVWTIDWFTHPNFLDSPIAVEAVMAAADLTFGALGAQKVYAGCPAGHRAFEQMLNDAGFIEVIPAGSLDQYTHKPRASSLFEMRREDWRAIRREFSDQNGALSLSSLGTATTQRLDLELL